MFEIKVNGSNGATYTIKRAQNGQDWYCSCPAWRFQRKNPSDRTCKHIKALVANLCAYQERVSA